MPSNANRVHFIQKVKNFDLWVNEVETNLGMWVRVKKVVSKEMGSKSVSFQNALLLYNLNYTCPCSNSSKKVALLLGSSLIFVLFLGSLCMLVLCSYAS